MLAYDNVNNSKKLIILFGRHLISMHILVIKEKGSPSPMHHDLCISRFMITFTWCFTMGKCTSEGTFPKS
jgi:hypothetical protein